MKTYIVDNTVKKRLFREIKNLKKGVIFNLLLEYDKYVIEITDREDGSVPVCVLEFYQNEYQEQTN